LSIFSAFSTITGFTKIISCSQFLGSASVKGEEEGGGGAGGGGEEWRRRRVRRDWIYEIISS